MRGCRGISMLELLFALAIMAIVGYGASKFFRDARDARALSMARTNATSEFQEVVDALKLGLRRRPAAGAIEFLDAAGGVACTWARGRAPCSGSYAGFRFGTGVGPLSVRTSCQAMPAVQSETPGTNVDVAAFLAARADRPSCVTCAAGQAPVVTATTPSPSGAQTRTYPLTWHGGQAGNPGSTQAPISSALCLSMQGSAVVARQFGIVLDARRRPSLMTKVSTHPFGSAAAVEIVR